MRDGGGARRLVASSFLAMGLAGCRAHVNANVNASGAEIENDRKWEIAEPSSPPDAPPAATAKQEPRAHSTLAAATARPSDIPFLGVTHDLSLSPGAPRSAVCRCLAVAYGPPSDGKFTWQAGAPVTDEATIAIAIAPDGVACPSGAPPVHASISGVESEGTDIVLIVEDVGNGRPIMRGALTTSPGPKGAIVVRTRHDTPYPSASGPGPCRIALK